MRNDDFPHFFLVIQHYFLFLPRNYKTRTFWKHQTLTCGNPVRHSKSFLYRILN